MKAAAGGLLAVLLTTAAHAQSIPGDVAAALDAEVVSSRAALAAARGGSHGNMPLAERQAQSARERGTAAVAAIVIDAISRYPAQANDIVAAAVAKSPESRAAVVSAVQRAYPTFANGASQAAAPPPAQTAARGSASTSRQRGTPAQPSIPADVLAELQRAAKPSPNASGAVAGSAGNQELAQRIAGYDQREVNTAMGGAVVTAIARYPNQTREIVSVAVATAPGARDSVVTQATTAFPAFAEAIQAGAASPGPQTAREETRASKRRMLDGPETLWDPIEPVNRGIFAVNDVLDQFLIRPVAWVYSYAPERVKLSVGNFFANLNTPSLFANDLLQGELVDATQTIYRFGVNTLIGVGGLFDPATSFGVPAHASDFGQTLFQYGVGPGPFIVLPLFGPSTLRDAVGTGVDSAMRPEGYLAPTVAVLAAGGVQAISKREALLKPLDELREGSVDYYATLRSAYYQNRVAKLNRQSGAGDTFGTSASRPSNTEVDKLFDEAK